MLTLNERYITDETGQRVGVILDMATYQKLLAELEELEELRAFDEAMQAGDEAIPFEQAVAEIEQGR